MGRARTLAGFASAINPTTNLNVGFATISTVLTDDLTGSGGGPPSFSKGLSITGFTTSTAGFSGNVSGTAATFTSGNFTGNVSIAGTLTYEDVTNIDAVGLITARSGIRITTGGFEVSAGVATVSGQSNLANVNVSAAGTVATLSATTATVSGQSTLGNTTVGLVTCTGLDSNTIMWEKVNVVADKLSGSPNINLDNGMVHYFTTQESTTSTPNIQSTVGLNTQMGNGDNVSVTIITTAAAAGYSTGILIDGVATSPLWSGGEDPSAGGGATGVDIWTYNIIKTASNTFTVIANTGNYA